MTEAIVRKNGKIVDVMVGGPDGRQSRSKPAIKEFIDEMEIAMSEPNIMEIGLGPRAWDLDFYNRLRDRR